MLTAQIKLSNGATLITYVQDSQIRYRRYKQRPAMVICPGGAYLVLATGESEPVAIEFMSRGFQCFILEYSVGASRAHPEYPPNANARYPIQVLQLMEALHIIQEHADEWHIDTERIYVMGYSAGGHVAASLGVRWNDMNLVRQLSFVPHDHELCPTGVILGYPMLRLDDIPDPLSQNPSNELPSQATRVYQTLLGVKNPTEQQKEPLNLAHYITDSAAPTFIWNCVDDPVIDFRTAMVFSMRLTEAGVPCEYHLFSRGKHGQPLWNTLTLPEGQTGDRGIAMWADLAMAWMGAREKKATCNE